LGGKLHTLLLQAMPFEFQSHQRSVIREPLPSREIIAAVYAHLPVEPSPDPLPVEQQSLNRLPHNRSVEQVAAQLTAACSPFALAYNVDDRAVGPFIDSNVYILDVIAGFGVQGEKRQPDRGGLLHAGEGARFERVRHNFALGIENSNVA